MQKLPASRKQLKGTNRPEMDRKGVKPGRAFSEPPPPPDGMSERACTAWKVLAAETVGLGVLTSADLPMLALLAETQATAAELEATIRDEGFTVSTAAGGRKSHPALKALESTRNAAGRLLQQFGLSPSSRKYVESAPTVSRENSGFRYQSRPGHDHGDDNPFQFSPPPPTDDEIKAMQARNRKRSSPK